LEIIAAPGQPQCFDPRKKLDYWLLVAECNERAGNLKEAERALKEAITWGCHPIARIHEAMDRIEKRKLLLVAASTPTKKYPEPNFQKISPRPIPSEQFSPETPDEPFLEIRDKYSAFFTEEESGRERTPKPAKLLIEEAAKAIQSAKPSRVTQLNSTPRKAPMSESRGSKVVLTPLRASKRVRSGNRPF
jgi:hypothetical protein